MEAVLVTGGAGFIGSHLCEKLLLDEYRVICLDNFITGSRQNIQQLISNRKFQLVEHDLIEPLPKEILDRQDIRSIFHLASPASPNKKSPKSYINHPVETLLVNSQGTYHLLEYARKIHGRFLYASSSEIYGDPKVSPQNESYFGNVNPNGIRSVYDEAKRFGEALTMAYVRTHDVDGRIVRIFNTYGPRMQKDDGRVVSNFITQALSQKPITVYGEGKQTRSFCFIDDMLNGLLKALFTQNTKGEVINLGNPDERTILELANKIKSLTQSSSEIIFEGLSQDDPKMRNPDIQKAKNLLQWNSEVSLDEGLKKTIAYFKSV